jgi:hypothetical protein
VKRNLIWLAILVVLVAGGWLAAFGAHSPCDAFRAEAEAIAAKEGGAYAKAVKASVIDKTDTMGTFQCLSGAMQIKLRGKDAITVLYVDRDTGKVRPAK